MADKTYFICTIKAYNLDFDVNITETHLLAKCKTLELRYTTELNRDVSKKIINLLQCCGSEPSLEFIDTTYRMMRFSFTSCDLAHTESFFLKIKGKTLKYSIDHLIANEKELYMQLNEEIKKTQVLRIELHMLKQQMLKM